MGKKSIIKKYKRLSILSGIAMGLVFPFFTLLFVSFKTKELFLLFLVSCISAGIIVGLVSFFIGKVTIIGAVKELEKSVSMMAHGELNCKCEVTSNDEIGQVIDGFNTLVSNLKGTVREINNNYNTVERDVISIKEKLTCLIENERCESNTSISHLEDSIREIKELSYGQVTNTEACADNLEFMKKNGEEIVDITNETEDGINSLIEVISYEGKRLNETQSVCQELSESARISSIKTKNLKDNSKNIVEIINSISEILKKTHTLALNAKIEASREHVDGKGFMIVAQEMVKLSQDTGSLVERIHGIADAIIEDIEKVSYDSEVSLKRILDFEDANSKSIANIENIFEQISENMRNVEEVGKKIYSQFEIIDKTKEQWGEIKEKSSIIDGFAEDHKLITHDIRSELKGIEELTERSYKSSRKLKERVGFFKI